MYIQDITHIHTNAINVTLILLKNVEECRLSLLFAVALMETVYLHPCKDPFPSNWSHIYDTFEIS